MRSATGAPRFPHALVADLVTAAGALLHPETPTQALRTPAPLAAHIRNTHVDSTGSRARLANWDFDF